MKPLRSWKSNATGANYPIGWEITVPGEELRFTIQPLLDNQELVLAPIIYWEGAYDLTGDAPGKRSPVTATSS